MSSLPPLVPVEQGTYETPSPAPVEGEAPPRIPNLGHALLLLLMATIAFLLTQGVLFLSTGAMHDPHRLAALAHNPKILIAVQAAIYLLTLVAAWIIFPLLWERPFAEGIQWNAPKAARFALKLIPAGIATSLIVQALSGLITMPKSVPMDQFFRTSSDIWLVAAFGTLVAPAVEEIFFRGFLFPAFAIAYDWLSLHRTPEAILLWRSTTTLTTASFFFSGFLTSVLFAWLHAAQLGHTWAAVALLLCVSCFFTYIRVITQSVACSTILHASYNLTIFVTTFLATGGFRHLEKMAR
jgi:membrane protease YdiL (CAAX protease family)